uniref:Uncharacterized protein n=1 Tax=Cyprinus carpio TaxID=7962 RepID=A0A8C2IPS3_CYPCA
MIAGAQRLKMASLSEDDFSCPVCKEIFKKPVVLSCSHSVCKECLQQFWRTKKTQECPVCRRRSSRDDPPVNLVLKNLCESFLKERNEVRSSGSEKICSLHHEKLKLFCLEDKQPVCVVCMNSQKHVNHTFRPIDEVVSSYKVRKVAFIQLHVVIKVLFKSEHTERQIKQQFEKLHQFLRDEEEATITALREEEEQKKQMMKEKLEEINTHISTLSHTIKDTEEMMRASDVSPVILDPNTAHPRLLLSDDLTSVRVIGINQPVPDNPERFDCHPCVLGSEGFNSGTHCWDVELKQSSGWRLGVTTASNQRKGGGFFNNGVCSVWYDPYSVWSLVYGWSPGSDFCVEHKLDSVRVNLDYERGTVSFSDPVTNTHLHTFTTSFTHTLFPFFCCYSSSLRILSINSQ